MDKQEFTDRVVACERKLFRIAYLTLGGYAHCEDAVQEALVKAWANRRALRNPVYFETWLIRILINECRNLQRRSCAMPTTALPENMTLPDPPDTALRDALGALNAKHRMPILLHHLEGYTVRETASILQATPGVVRWRLEQGKRELRKLLSDEEEYQ
jgi:RNA polymerase sigma-70 factor (ECF subfamily)